MASPNDNVSMALFCDFENVALGVRDANYDKFDIKPVLERLLLKGSIVVKKAYCDWDRYKGFKAPMHEANFELIEIPHVRQSGKNSADIRMVVDALDLCYTKSHVDTFVIISGDSDFSPLVSKLRENAKKVIGVGVKQSTSDLLVANCDEFIFYDDLVRESRRAAKRDSRDAQPAVKRTPEEETRRREEMEKRRNQAMEIVVGTFDALVSERGDSGKIWASVLKEAIKRRKPDFSESYYGFRTFGNLLEEARARGLLEFGRDEKSGAYVYRSSGAANGHGLADGAGVTEAAAPAETVEAPRQEGRHEGRQDGRRGRGRGRGQSGRHGERAERADESASELVMDAEPEVLDAEPFEVVDVVEVVELVEVLAPADEGEVVADADIIDAEVVEPRQEGRHGRGKRGGRKQAERKGGKAAASAVDTVAAQSPASAEHVAPAHDASQAVDAEAAQAVEPDAAAAQVSDAEPAKPAKAAKPPAKGARATKAAAKKKAATKDKAKPAAEAADVVEAAPAAAPSTEPAAAAEAPSAASHDAEVPAKAAKPAKSDRKPQPRGRRPRKDAKSEA
ncbi:NYN domain-containing protein [Duganella sp. LX20W]|uniref:NYN domain-containing protein n=1 Tax=Rugamonas brunnea TaxID=2758569 RepID=A0A7W2ERX6_9BURK|nr:NYN domain-containing protein [Rugamonas brunnea]MBA5637399.1 NYN domain-containing protein [Rugamonas brunnea]